MADFVRQIGGVEMSPIQLGTRCIPYFILREKGTHCVHIVSIEILVKSLRNAETISKFGYSLFM